MHTSIKWIGSMESGRIIAENDEKYQKIILWQQQLWTLFYIFTTMDTAVNYELQVRLEDVR